MATAGVQHGMAGFAWQALMARGLAVITWRHINARLTSFGTIGALLIWLAAARGDRATVASAWPFMPLFTPATCWITLPAARGESSASAAVRLTVVTARVMAPRARRI